MLYLEAHRRLAGAGGRLRHRRQTISASRSACWFPGCGTRAIRENAALGTPGRLQVGRDDVPYSEIVVDGQRHGPVPPGTDITSGYSVMPRHDNTFGGGNFDADDLDEWLTIQRGCRWTRGSSRSRRDELLRISASERRERAGGVRVASDLRRGGYAGHARLRRPRSTVTEPTSRRRTLWRAGVRVLDVALALDRRGFPDVAEAVLGMHASGCPATT